MNEEEIIEENDRRDSEIAYLCGRQDYEDGIEINSCHSDRWKSDSCLLDCYQAGWKDARLNDSLRIPQDLI